MKNNKVISVVTPSYNQGEFIEETIQSILSQEGDFYLDYIIMDGGSNDNSVEIIKKYEDLLKQNCEKIKIGNLEFYSLCKKSFKWNKCKGISYRWVSEKDEGQADAINKGLKKAEGEVLCWLNSDDLFYPGALRTIADKDFEKSEFYYGKGMWISRIGKDILPYPTFEPTFYSFYYQCTLCQPTVFFSKKVIDEIGVLDNSFYCNLDFELWMRALSLGKKFTFINRFLARSRMYEENKSLANEEKVKNEIGLLKDKYYSKLNLDDKKIADYIKIHNETFDRVQDLNFKLKTGSKLNVLFDATVIANALEKNEGRSGIFFVAFNILKEMLRRKDLNILLYCENFKKKDLEKVLFIYFKNNNLQVVNESEFNSFANKEEHNIYQNIDVFFSPIFRVPDFIERKSKILKFIIIHDIILVLFPEFFPKKNSQPWFNELMESLNSEDYYFAISNNTKKDLLNFSTKINSENVEVSHLAASDRFTPKSKNEITKVLEKYNLPTDKKFIFSLCTLEPRKNLIMLVKCFVNFIKSNKIDDLYLFLGGSQWDDFIIQLEKEIEDLGEYKNKIIRLGYLDDEDLPYFYSGTEFFVYPTLYEGFGLPVLEAMKCGVPVITSNVSSVPEVIGEAGVKINPKSENELLEAFSKLHFDDKLKKELSQKSIDRAKNFSWEKTVDTMVSFMLNKIKEKSDDINNRKDVYAEGENKFIDSVRRIWASIVFAVTSPKKFFMKYFNKLLTSRFRQPARKVWYFIQGKKIK